MRIHRHLRHPSLVIGAVIVGVIVLVATFAPWVTSYDPEQMDMANRLAGPSRLHILGTDNFGRDLWTRVAFGARISLVIGLISVSVAAVAGTLVGLVAGYYRGWVDLLLMRVVDLFLGFPPIILALALVAALGPGVVNVTIALVAVFWTQYARVVRAITVVESEREYVAAARAIGMPGARILLRQILPGTIGPVVVLATLGIGTAIIAESGLSFLGFGVQPPTPTWGWTLAYGMRFLRTDVWLSTVPGLFIMITVLGFNLFGDGLRDVLDPKGRVGR
jgi:peptide/nickel transport system permease protein